jgi:hypothetical protein
VSSSLSEFREIEIEILISSLLQISPVELTRRWSIPERFRLSIETNITPLTHQTRVQSQENIMSVMVVYKEHQPEETKHKHGND